VGVVAQWKSIDTFKYQVGKGSNPFDSHPAHFLLKLPMSFETLLPEITATDLEICLKVLQKVADDPTVINTHDRFKSLVAKIHKTGKKAQRQAVQIQHRQDDRALKESSAIVQAIQAKSNQLTSDKDLIPLLKGELGESQPTLQTDAQRPGLNPQPTLHKTCNCYICKQPYRQIHPFYHLLCPTCADFNYEKRHQRADLTGRTALVTGGRIKIGYQTALRLLQDGARVIVTSRFPQDAAQRFSQEPDFTAWADRLQIHGLDLRHLPAVEAFTQALLTTESSLDIIINNAAQTIKRPLAFYRELLQVEQKLSPSLQQLLPGKSATALSERLDATVLATIDLYFPANQFDAEGQPIDLRPTNSWMLKLDQVDTVELLEVQLVNAIAPFLLNSKLKPLMLQSPHDRRFIINVSAMEGQFNRASKTIYHPHTNMAKAALNMMTRTSAADYAEDGIYINSVDTGWVTDENPYAKREYLRDDRGFYPPLDIIDGMARIYDPIVQGVNVAEVPIYGQFLKDYQPHAW
jgi:NAD(P)-dependent dehydrogenase (short-subunit alcohol dehydrogenase family)